MAAAGHASIRAYSSGFRVVGSTAAVDARDNTGTIYTSADKGVPIYWLGGSKVADDYEDFYDGSWDNESPTDESGSARDLTTISNNPMTGSTDVGTEDTGFSLGSNSVTAGAPNASSPGDNPLKGVFGALKTLTRPFYGLSAVLTVKAPPTLSIADASAAENDGQLMFEVTLSRALQDTVKVDFETISGGTATEGVDYHARRTYTHVILEGDKTAQMGFALIEDTVAAAGETVKVRLSNARVVDAYGNKIKDLDITTDEATGTITAPSTTTTNVPGLTIGIRDATGDEDDGYLDFRVRLSRKHDDYVCYDFETISGGTATEGMDYLKFPKATYWMQIGKRVDKPFVRIIDDRVNDNGETVKVKISNARLCNDASQTLSITRAEATGTIRNSDPLPRALKARFGRTVARAGGGGQETVLNFAHFANGNGTTSDLVFVNVSTRPSGPGLSPYHAVILPSRPTLYFYDQEGHLIDPASVVDLTGDLVVTEDGALSIQTEMEPLGELTISTHGRGELVSGSVKVVSEGPIGGVLRYALPGIGVTGVGASQSVRDALFPVRQEGGLDTAAAIHNLSESDLVVTCRLMKEGAVLEETEIPLAANGQESQYIEEMFTFTGADVSDFVGSVRCTVPAEGEGMFTGVAVEIDEINRILTTVPVVPVQERMDRE